MLSNFKTNPLYAFIFVLPFVYGGFHEFVSGLLSVSLLILLIIMFKKGGSGKGSKKGSLQIPVNISFFAVLSLPVFYLLSAFWAVDRGMALIGFVKYLPLPLFVLLSANYPEEKRQACFKAIPYSAALMTVISFVLSFLPVTKGHITVAGRLGGFFEYPNTFALFLLLGLIVMSMEGAGKGNTADEGNKGFPQKKKIMGGKGHIIIQALTALILLLGIFLSGSRAVFVLLIISALTVALFSKNKAVRRVTLAVVPSAVGAAVIFALITNNFYSIGRFLTSSLTESTFVGRLLYFKDAIPQILTHPLGQGYGSYLYTQGTFQTGVYNVKFVHNDFLQLFFEIGWLPALLLTAAVVCSFFKKGEYQSAGKRLMLAVICIHGMFDFSLQYMAVFFILLLLLDRGGARTASAGKAAGNVIAFSCGAAAVFCLYFSVACFFEFLGNYAISTAMYPSYTEGYVHLMIGEQDLTEAKKLSDKITELNQSVYQTYLIQSAYDFQNGDVLSAIQNKEKAISLSPYTFDSYIEYIDMLYAAYNIYTETGDPDSAEYCRKKIVTVPSLLQELKERTSSLGMMIDDKPRTELPKEYFDMIEGLYSKRMNKNE